MKDNTYVYAIDCSLMKGSKGNDSEIIIFEHQPYICSGLGAEHWNYKNAFETKFPNTSISIDSEGRRIKIFPSKPSTRMLIKNSERVSYDDYTRIKQGYYKHVHTISFEEEVDKLNNKINQRLYLPDEVSPEYYILNSNLESNTLTEKVFNYFTSKGISKIVLKSAVDHCGEGNIFIADLYDKQVLESGIKKLRSPYHQYFLAEEQKVFPRISRKTGEKKSGYLSYRMIGIANREGDLGYFIASKSISDNIDSHQREKMKCYFETAGKKYQKEDGWLFEAHGTKDKYYGKGDNPITINPDLMHKISKRMYQLYADMKTMSDKAFKQHIDHLVTRKNDLNSRAEKIAHFTIEDRKEQELINRMDASAFNRACNSYRPLASDIAEEMVSKNTVNLSELNCGNRNLTFFFYEMYKKNKYDALKTASKSQLAYYFNDYKGIKRIGSDVVTQTDSTSLNLDKENESLAGNINELKSTSEKSSLFLSSCFESNSNYESEKESKQPILVR